MAEGIVNILVRMIEDSAAATPHLVDSVNVKHFQSCRDHLSFGDERSRYYTLSTQQNCSLGERGGGGKGWGGSISNLSILDTFDRKVSIVVTEEETFQKVTKLSLVFLESGSTDHVHHLTSSSTGAYTDRHGSTTEPCGTATILQLRT